MSGGRLRTANLVVAGLGVLVAGYLTLIHYAGIAPICAGGGGGCETVQASQWSRLAGIPVAVLGLGGYLLMLTAAWLRGETARFAGAALALIGAGYSAYLTYLELFEINAICQWCVVSAILMGLLAVIAVARLLRDEDPAQPLPLT